MPPSYQLHTPLVPCAPGEFAGPHRGMAASVLNVLSEPVAVPPALVAEILKW